jgi:hypothetical protein
MASQQILSVPVYDDESGKVLFNLCFLSLSFEFLLIIDNYFRVCLWSSFSIQIIGMFDIQDALRLILILKGESPPKTLSMNVGEAVSMWLFCSFLRYFLFIEYIHFSIRFVEI